MIAGPDKIIIEIERPNDDLLEFNVMKIRSGKLISNFSIKEDGQKITIPLGTTIMFGPNYAVLQDDNKKILLVMETSNIYAIDL